MTEFDDDGARALFFDAHLFVCTNRRQDGHARGSCAAKGAEQLRDYMKARVKERGVGKVRVNSAGCLDRCELGPCVVVYPKGVWYRVATPDDVDRVLAAQFDEGHSASDLELPAA